MLCARQAIVCREEALNVPNDHTRLEFIFHEALAKTSPQVRAAYLDEACRGAPTLRDDIESLLSAHDEADGFLPLPKDVVSVPPPQSSLSHTSIDSKLAPNTHPLEPN
jgi:hypothetical protein